MIRWRAKVKMREDSVNPSTAGDTPNEESNRIPVPDWIEIEQRTEGYLLIHVYFREGPFIHTWHATVEEAKEEAKTDFGVEEGDWEKELLKEI
jgi:hypothetical protein